jgi:diamine N-acetyltransferase
MLVQLKDHKQLTIRLLEATDSEKLLHYFEGLSATTKSRFGPHPFDKETVENICKNLPGHTLRYVAVDESANKIVAYMLVKPGLIEWDAQRYAIRHQFFDDATTVTYAPSVADEWQSSGLGSAMYTYIEQELKKRGVKKIILWGGVQAGNQKALHFYSKYGYRCIAPFRHDGKDNYDMLKELN